MRRFVTLAVLLLSTLPFGISIAGCSKASPAQFCNGQNSGVVVGQTTTLDLEPRLTGISLNQGQIGSISSPSGKDCKGTSSSVSGVIYGSSDMTLVDVVPQTGRLCAGTWNRQTGGGIPDYTVCTPTTRQGTAFITASAEGVVSNPVPVYVHPVVTSIILGPASTNCATDPASNCILDSTTTNGCNTSTPSAASAYTGNSCLSQGKSAQLVARTYKGTDITNPANNISCLVGPLSFSAINSSVVTIDTNGLATAAQPGSTTINANASQASSSAGFFSTCPPKSISLSVPGANTNPVTATQNTSQSLVATVIDTLGAPITNLQLEYVSTSPTTIPASGSTFTPTFPGSTAIYAICQPPSCNYSPFNEIGLFGNGTPVTSNPVQVTATGANNSTVLVIGSTNSQYLQPVDFTTTTQGSPLRLPFVPNSMVLSQDLSTIYLGSSTEIMVVSVSNSTLSLARQDTSVVGTVLAVSPDNGTVVITDPTRNLTYLYNSAGGVGTQYGGTATRAQFTPDSQNVYITTTDGRLLVHSTFTGWTAVPLPSLATDVAVTIPAAGVYLGGSPVTARTNCPITSVNGTGLNQQTTNTFYPQIDVTAAVASRIAATNDGVHIIGASNSALTDITTNTKSGSCPVPFTSSIGAVRPFSGIAASSITSVLPTSDSAYTFVTYQGSGGVVPQYAEGSTALTNVPLQNTAAGAPIAPVAGVVSSDNQTLYVGTSGDNLVHRLTRGASGFTDTITPVTPNLPGFTGGIATPDLLVQRPRKSTS